MTAYTDRIRRAADWIDQHPNLPAPAVRATPGVQLAWHMNRDPLSKQMSVLDAVREALGDVPWDVKKSGDLMWVTTEDEYGLSFTVFVSAASLEGFTELDLTTRMTR
jgi:hypothetical protein